MTKPYTIRHQLGCLDRTPADQPVRELSARLAQRLSLPPFSLLRWALPLLMVAFSILALAETRIALTGAMMTLGIGMGLAGPGFMAGAYLAVSPEEQGSVAGVAGSCGPLGFTIGPLIGGAR